MRRILNAIRYAPLWLYVRLYVVWPVQVEVLLEEERDAKPE